MADEPIPQLPDMGALLGMAMEMQQQMVVAQQQAAETVVEGQAGGGAVKIAVTGGWQFQSVSISPDALDPDDVDMLQDLVLAALRDAVDQVQELTNESNPLASLGLGGGQAGGLGGLGDLDLGGIFGQPAPGGDIHGLATLGGLGFDPSAITGALAADDPTFDAELEELGDFGSDPAGDDGGAGGGAAAPRS